MGIPDPIGSFSFVLHSHIPFVRQAGGWPFGEEMLYEVMAESYIPILNALYDLLDDGYSPSITIGLTPVLVEQLRDSHIREHFGEYVEERIQLARQTRVSFEEQGIDYAVQVIDFFTNWYQQILQTYRERYNTNLVAAFKRLQEANVIEILTSAATHAYLPLLSTESNIWAQIMAGISSYKKIFGQDPQGIWLPECAYRPGYRWKPPVGEDKPSRERPGIQNFLANANIRYFLIDTPLLIGGETIGVYIHRFEALQKLWTAFESQYVERAVDVTKTPYSPYLLSAGKKAVAVFTRDPKSGLVVWSGEWGYPGDGWYNEFHKREMHSGLRLWRITSGEADLADKWYYDPSMAAKRIPENASHFVHLVKETLMDHHRQTGQQGILCAVYDTELFGHWWFEGPEWLKLVLKGLCEESVVELTTCGRFLEAYPPDTIVSLPEGSWGKGGFHWIWMNADTAFIWEKIYECEAKMEELAVKYADAATTDPRLEQILKQTIRELFLLQSSDWPFLITTWQARDYAAMRFSEHYESFQRLSRICDAYHATRTLPPEDERFLAAIEERDNLLPEIDVHWFLYSYEKESI